MQIRRVPVDLLFVSGDGITERSSSIIPVISHKPAMDYVLALLHGQDDSVADWRQEANLHAARGSAGMHIAKWRRKVFWRRWPSWLPLGPRPRVTRLVNDTLVVDSGIEQACLAKTLDRRWIRVDIPDDVCEAWDRRSTQALDVVVKQTRRKLFYNPVLHEHYRKVRVERPDSIRVDRIRRVLVDHGYGLKGLDVGCNMGYMCHMLQRQGIAMTGLDFDENHLGVARALNETYGFNGEFVNKRLEDFSVTHRYDIIVLLTVLYHTLKRGETLAIDFVKRLEQMKPSALFWESGEQPAREIDLIRTHTGLTEYLALGSTVATGKHREQGVFLRPSTSLCTNLQDQYAIEWPAPA